MRQGAIFVSSILSAWLFVQPAVAEKRVALVVGNSSYENVARLNNPANDATAITAILKDAGFDIVESRRDLKTSEMRRVLRDFSDKVRDAEVAVVYYAGHGIEVDGTNYLIPVDATLERDLDVYDEAFPLDRILAVIEPAKQLRLVILDACRDNPFAKTMKRTTGSRSIGRGLAKVEPTSPNTLIAFASKAGSTASDGDSKNSPFTSALLKHIAIPGLDLRKAFGFVRDDVLKNTGNRQEPYVYGSLGGGDVSLVPAKPAVTTSAPANLNAEMRRNYEFAQQIGTRSIWLSFLNTYPDGFYADLAKGQLDKIASEEARVAAGEKARLAQEEKARLAAEGAKQGDQQKAAAEAAAAEKAKTAAEKAKQIEQEKVAAAERARILRERIAAEKAAAAQAEADKTAAKKTATENAAPEIVADKSVDEKISPDKGVVVAGALEQKPPQQLAALPPDVPAAKPELSAADIARSVQTELRRVGCFTGSIDGDWSTSSRRSLEQFNKRVGMKLDVKLASLDALDAIRAKPARICPLTCEQGFRADGERCVKITCGAGSFLNDDNECERKRAKPPPRREVRREVSPMVERASPPMGRRRCAPASSNYAKMSGKPLCL